MSDAPESEKKKSAARALLDELTRCGSISLDRETYDARESELANEQLHKEVVKRGGFPVEGSGKECVDSEYRDEEK